MISLKKMLAVAGVAVVLAAGSVAVAAPAQAMNEVNCKSGTGFLTIVAQGANPTKCYANAGDQYTPILTSNQLFAGNNVGYVDSNKGQVAFQKYQNKQYSLRDIFYARIY